MKVKIKKLHEDAVIPSYAKHGDAGVDLYSVRLEKDKKQNDVHYTGLAWDAYVNAVFYSTLFYLEDKLGFWNGYRYWLLLSKEITKV